MKERIILFFKGMLLGIAMIIPGVSGGTLAISLGIYEQIISVISHFFKNFKNNLIFIVNLGLGVLASIILGALVLNYTFEHAPIPTIVFFIGLLLGSIPMLFKKVNIKKTISISKIIYFLIGVFIVVGVSLLKSGKEITFTEGFSIIQTIKLIIVGVLGAMSLVVPGISGSFLLMVLGYYEPILKTISDIVKFNNIFNNILILAPFGIGVIVGIVAISKLIEYLLKKYEIQTYYAIIGFLVASILEISISIFNYSANTIQIIVSIFLFVLGLLLTLKVFKNE